MAFIEPMHCNEPNITNLPTDAIVSNISFDKDSF